MVCQQYKLWFEIHKTWEGFDLTILKVKQIHYRESKFLQLDLTLNLLLSLITYWHDHMQASTPRILHFLDLHHTSTHACNFEIPLKGLALQTFQFVAPKPPLKD